MDKTKKTTLHYRILDICLVEDYSDYGDVWRFLPSLDQNVSIMVSRDLDSKVLENNTANILLNIVNPILDNSKRSSSCV